jgi:hypothetical protein
MADPIYRSQIDKGLLMVFTASTVVSVIAVLSVLYSCLTSGVSFGSLLAIPILFAGAVLPWWIVLTTEYTLTGRSLEIRSGPFHWSIPLREITRIEFTRHPGSSPALSLDRLRIQHAAGAQMMISPENRERFLAELRSRGVGVEVRR